MSVEGGSGVLWGAAALALTGTATAIALDQARRRREEEARQRAEMERRNAELHAKEQAKQAAIAPAAAKAKGDKPPQAAEWAAKDDAVAAAAAAAVAETARPESDRFEWQEQRRQAREVAAQEAETHEEPQSAGATAPEPATSAEEQPAAPAAPRSDDLMWDALFTLANAVGTLMVVSGGFSGGTTSVLGGVLLVANVVRQVIQIAGDYSEFQSGRMSQEVFIWNTAWNVADAIPGVGVATGLIQLVNEHILPWARSYGGR